MTRLRSDDRPGDRDGRRHDGLPGRDGRVRARRRLVVPPAAGHSVERRRGRARRRPGAAVRPAGRHHLCHDVRQQERRASQARRSRSRAPWNSNDTITVKQTRPAAGFFSKVLGISTVNVHAKATAVAAIPAQTLGLAPITVNILHPQLSGAGCPCFNVPTTLPLGKTGAPGAFALLDLDYGDTNGTVGASTLASWISQGYDSYLPLGVYFSDPGAKWNNSIIQNALISRLRHRPAVPGLRHARRPRLERRVPRDRAGSASTSRRHAPAAIAVRSLATSRESSGRESSASPGRTTPASPTSASARSPSSTDQRRNPNDLPPPQYRRRHRARARRGAC